MITIPYDQSYEPPVPACEVTLSVSSSDQRVSISALIDTGADATIVPVDFLRQIGAQRVFESSLRSQWGERRRVYLYLVDLRVENLTLPGVYVVGDDLGNEVVLGRDVLNRMRLLLDGPIRMMQLLD